MYTKLKSFTIAGLISLMGLGSIPAHADSFYLGFGDRDDYARGGAYVDRDYDRYDDRRYDDRRSERRCSPDRALDKAERMGVRRARVDFVSKRRIGVIGRRHGDRIEVVFARAPGCPIIS